jgi:hypothetical protein
MAATDHRTRTLPPPTTPGSWYRSGWLHLALGLALVAGTVGLASQRATDGVRAALDARLATAGAGADAGLVAIESEQLAAVRAIAFTRGVARALAAHHTRELNRIVAPLQANSTVPMIDMVLPNGRVQLAVRSKGAPAPVRSRHGLLALTQALRRARGARGGRLSEVVVLRSGPTLLAISPVMDGTTPAGVVLAMTPLANVLGRLTQEVGADLTVYDARGLPLATSATVAPDPVASDTARALLGGGAVVTRSVRVGHRETLGRLIVDHTPDAVLGVSLADDSSDTGRLVALYVALGLLCTAVIVASYLARTGLSWRSR